MLPPAARLEGMTLPSGWKVLEKIDLESITTGGNFGCAYRVEHPEKGRAFLKALDIKSRMRTVPLEQFADEMKKLMDAYIFERDIVRGSGSTAMTRVVRAVDDGTVAVPGDEGFPVPYLVFEMADGDIRQFLTFSRKVDLAWILRVLHQVAVGLNQLHTNFIAHQDLKPSNILSFNRESADVKVSDFGAASRREAAGPRDAFKFAGDPSYAPIEQQYGFQPNEWNERRLACDAYHLGSMIVFFFLGASMTRLIHKYLQPQHNWHNWAGSYEEVLPYVTHAFDDAIDEVERQLPDEMEEPTKRDIIQALRQLCDPRVSQRGHPAERGGIGNPFSLIRYISLFDRMATLAEIQMKKVIRK
jgi:eukaryotic-like serine/threonine-protein kinase